MNVWHAWKEEHVIIEKKIVINDIEEKTKHFSKILPLNRRTEKNVTTWKKIFKKSDGRKINKKECDGWIVNKKESDKWKWTKKVVTLWTMNRKESDNW